MKTNTRVMTVLNLVVMFVLGLTGATAASGAESIVVVQWGGPFIEASKPIGEAFTKETGIPVAWELHTGGSAGVIPKIRATWPSVKYDVVAAGEAVFLAMRKEGWLAPLRPEEVPVLSEIFDVAKGKDAKTKEIFSVAMSRAFIGWAYRADKLGEPLSSIKQVFSPKLKNRVCIHAIVPNQGLMPVTFALARGGNEYNIEPGFTAIKELARTGNIRKVMTTEAEAVTSLVTGDCWVAFWSSGAFLAAAKDAPVKAAFRLNDTKSFVLHEALGILNGPRSAEAKKFVNFFLQAKWNEQYNKHLAELPTNKMARATALAAEFALTDEEIKTYGYVPDWDHLIKNLDAWNKRWEAEVVPLLKR